MVQGAVSLTLATPPFHPQVFAPGELERYISCKRKLDALHSLYSSLRSVCDTSFMFWHRQLTGLYLQVRTASHVAVGLFLLLARNFFFSLRRHTRARTQTHIHTLIRALFFHQELYENPGEAHRLQYMFAALGDCVPMTRNAENITSEPLKVGPRAAARHWPALGLGHRRR